jgi:hypothetical protein
VKRIDRFIRWEVFHQDRWLHCPGFLAKAFVASHGLTGERLKKARHELMTRLAHYENDYGERLPFRLAPDLRPLYNTLRYTAREAIVKAWLANTFLPRGLSMEGIKHLFYKSHKINVPDSIFRRVKEVVS